MRGIVFALLTVILGGVLGLGLEYLTQFLPGKIAYELTRVFSVGIHPLTLGFTVCGVLGLVFAYLILIKFVKK